MVDTYELDISKNLINANYITSYIDTKLTELENSMLDKICGVGEILITTREGNPSTWLGRGTWEQIKEGVTLLSAGSTYTVNSEGGEASHAITEAEMPSHTHTQATHNHNRGNMDITGTIPLVWSDTRSLGLMGAFYRGSNSSNGIMGSGIGTYSYQPSFSASRSWEGNTNTVAPTINSAGSGNAMSLMQPYLAVYMWRRTA